SGERKSAADDIALEPHRLHERAAADQYRNDIIAYEAELPAYDSQRKAASKKKDPLDIEAEFRRIGPAPEIPLQPWILVSTPTVEGLHRLCRDGQPSLGLFHDDGGEFLAGHAMAAENRMKSAASLSKWWDRGEFDRIRASDGAVKFFGRRLALHLMIQPVVAESVLSDSILCGQGFLAR